MLGDWPRLISYLSRDAQQGVGNLIGIIFLFWLVAAFGASKAKRDRGEWW
jgi:hypothetical protein